MNKELIKTRFSKSLSTYNENAKIQKKMAEKLGGLLNKESYENILEIGCGTGFLTEILNQKTRFKKYTAIDIVSDCDSYIGKINPEISFINEDVEAFIEKNTTKYDLIISNASLQWISDLKTVITELESRLNKNGELIFSIFGIENFREIAMITGASLDYNTPNELKSMFPNSEIYPEIHIMAFQTPKDVLKHLQLTGVNAIESKNWVKKDLEKFERGYKNLCPTRPTLTYNPIYIKLCKN